MIFSRRDADTLQCRPAVLVRMAHEGWTAEQMGDLSGKTVIVTGANSGLGYEATKAFARHGADVVLACRSTERGNEAAERIRGGLPDSSLTVLELDLADLSSVQEFATTFFFPIVIDTVKNLPLVALTLLPS